MLMKMEEILYAYDKKGNIVAHGSKKRILNEQKKVSFSAGDCPFAVPVVYLLLSHPKEGIYTVQRANKSENPYLWCKPVGGHISSGETPESTLIREGQEEIKTDIIIAKSIENYNHLISKNDISEKAIVRMVNLQPWFGTYRLDKDTGKVWMKRTRAFIYAGVYSGKIKFTKATDQEDFSDGLGEAINAKIYQKEDLERVLLEKNDLFTDDFKVLFKDYKAFL